MKKLIHYLLVILLSTAFCFNSCSDERNPDSPAEKQLSPEIQSKLEVALDKVIKANILKGCCYSSVKNFVESS